MPQNIQDDYDAAAMVQQAVSAARQGLLSFEDLRRVARIFVDAKNIEVASYLYQEWLANTKSPMAYIIYADHGDALSLANDIAGARAAYEASLQMNPNSERARAALAWLSQQTRPEPAAPQVSEKLIVSNFDVGPSPDGGSVSCAVTLSNGQAAMMVLSKDSTIELVKALLDAIPPST
ncbi:MAG: hypothetical protein WCJ64_05290 [Rhodospirillaceae bacterium]